MTTPKPFASPRPARGTDDPLLPLSRKVLLMGCGLDARPNSMHRYIVGAGMECASYDNANGPLNALADSFVFERLMSEAKAGDYAAAFACPDTTFFPRFRSTVGAGRYGDLDDLTPK